MTPSQIIKAAQANTNRQYGLLIYDIAEKEMKTYRRMRDAIRGKSIRINLSNYLCDWSMLASLEATIRNIQNDGGNCEAHFLKFDNASEAKIKELAVKGLTEQLQRAKDSLRKQVKLAESMLTNAKDFLWRGEKLDEVEAIEKSTDIRTTAIDTATKLLEEVKSAAMLFGFNDDIEMIYEASVKLVAAEQKREAALLADAEAKEKAATKKAATKKAAVKK